MKTILDMPASEYHAHEAVSNSLISKILKSPAHARAYLDGATDEQTPAMAFGTAFHMAVLEPVRFAESYSVFDMDGRTKEGKAAKQAMLDSGQTIISATDWDTIQGMCVSILRNPTASSLLTDGVSESSYFWTDKDTGLECKCRPDFQSNGTPYIVDLKSTEDASPAGFARSIAAYGYHRQAAHYMAGTGAEKFYFVAVEKKAPFAVAVYELDALALDQGWREVRRALDYWKDCTTAQMFPGYQEEIVTLGLPTWAMKEDV
jgi:hypothetical protein